MTPAPTRRWLDFAILYLIVLAALGLGYALGKFRTPDKFFEIGPEAARMGRLVTRNEWPETFVELFKAADESPSDVGSRCVYQMPYGEYYLISETSPKLLALMYGRWKLKPVGADHEVARLFEKRLPGSVGPSIRAGERKYFVSANWLDAGKGHLYCVMTDETKGVVVARYYYNF